MCGGGGRKCWKDSFGELKELKHKHSSLMEFVGGLKVKNPRSFETPLCIGRWPDMTIGIAVRQHQLCGAPKLLWGAEWMAWHSIEENVEDHTSGMALLHPIL